MDRQPPAPGPEIGWAFGGLGFVVTILVGSVVGAGLGFVALSLVLWAALGALFAFLVERSQIEEHDRHDELQNTRLATLQPRREVRVRDARADGEPSRPEPAAEAPDEAGPAFGPQLPDPEPSHEPRAARAVSGYRRPAPAEDVERDPAAA